MAEFFTPKNLAEAERDYKESCARRDQFHAAHPEVFKQDVTLHVGEEPLNGIRVSGKIRAQYLSIMKECEIKFEGMKAFKKAAEADKSKKTR